MFLIGILALALIPCGHAAHESLYVSVHVDRTHENGAVVLAIYGHVMRLNQSSVPLASISIQVTDPYGSSVHVALVHSDNDGSYSDVIELSSDRPAGNYTIYVTASKPGFEDGHAKLPFSIGMPSFAVSVFPNSVTVAQGESATFRIEIESRGPGLSPVHIEVVGFPAYFSYSLSSNDRPPPSSITLTVQTPSHASPGSYMFALIGVSAEGEARADVEIIVQHAATPEYLAPASLIIAVFVVVGIMLYTLSRRRRVKKTVPDSSVASPEYLEGLPLSPSTLFSLPDHLRKTAVILCQLREASAAEVAARSGRARAAESDYLNQLARMGLVKKKRRGRESYFSVE